MDRLIVDCATGEAEVGEAVIVPVVVPACVTPRQARLALLGAGLLDTAEAAIAALPSPTREAAQVEWEYATEIRRDSPLVASIGAALMLNDAAIDALFMTAGAL